jgi:hypothetical protein
MGLLKERKVQVTQLMKRIDQSIPILRYHWFITKIESTYIEEFKGY